MRDYRAVADAVAADIASGKLSPGMRLPPQRTFAYEHGIAVSTASRVYAELVRRGLVIGAVGRGTFVRAPETLRAARNGEVSEATVDLLVATSMSLEQATLLAPALKSFSGPAALYGSLDALGPFGPSGAGETVAGFLQHKRWAPEPADILFAAGGRQAIASAVAALCKPGDRIGVEPLTYPAIMRSASQLGIQLVPIAVDDEGIDIAALAKIHRAEPLAALYIQPSVHNPLGISMKAARREALAHARRRLGGLVAVDAFGPVLDLGRDGGARRRPQASGCPGPPAARRRDPRWRGSIRGQECIPPLARIARALARRQVRLGCRIARCRHHPGERLCRHSRRCTQRGAHRHFRAAAAGTGTRAAAAPDAARGHAKRSRDGVTRDTLGCGPPISGRSPGNPVLRHP